MRFGLIVTAAIVVCLAPAAAQKHPKKPVDPNKKICRMEAATGSLVGTRSTCHTYAEWQAIDAANGEQTRNFRNAQSSGSINH